MPARCPPYGPFALIAQSPCDTEPLICAKRRTIMTAHAISRTQNARTGARAVLTLPFACLVLVVAAAAVFVSDVLWPTWPSRPTPLDAPAIPITVAGVLFDVPPAAIREAVQRHAGQQERIDLAFEWPSLAPPRPDDKARGKTALERRRTPQRPPRHPRTSGCSSPLPGSRRRAAAARAAAHHLSALCRIPGQRRPGRACHPAVPRRHALCGRGSGLYRQQSRTIFRAAARGRRAVACPAPASRNACSTPPRSRCVFRAIGSAIGARSPPASTGSSRNCIRSEIDGSAGRRSKARTAARLRPNPYPESAFQEYRTRAASHRRQIIRR